MAQQQIETLEGTPGERLQRCWRSKWKAWTRKQLRTLADSLRNKWGSAVIVIASVNDSHISIVSAVSKDLTGKVQAGKLVGDVAQGDWRQGRRTSRYGRRRR